MENWVVALIAAAGAVGGAAVSGVVAFRVARLERQARDSDELRAALVAYGAALDRLTLKVDQLPQAHGVKEGWTAKVVARWRALDWLFGRLSVATVGRGVMATVDEVIAATNRLLLVAPAPVLNDMERLSDLIGCFDPGAVTWRAEWKEARAVFAATARTTAISAAANRKRVPKYVPDSTEMSRTGLESADNPGTDRPKLTC